MALAMQIYEATSLCNMEVGFMFIPGIPFLFHIAVKQTDPVCHIAVKQTDPV